VTLETSVTMVVVLAVVWGGFAIALATAMRKEARKLSNRDQQQGAE